MSVLLTLCALMNLARALNCTYPCQCTTVDFPPRGRMVNVNCRSDNRSFVPDLSFLKNAKYPVRLSLKLGEIKKVERSDFQPYMNITMLDLSENGGIRLADDSLQNLAGLLEYLDIGGNVLAFADTFPFLKGLNKLQMLVMATDRSGRFNVSGKRVLHKDSFRGLQLLSVRELDMSGCRLSEIEDGAFDPLSSLTKLTLINNLLSAVPGRLATVVSLEVGQNRFKNIPGNSFDGYAKLESLRLNFNFNLELDNNSFRGLEQMLKELDLSYCGFHRPPIQSLQRLTSLHKLIFENNKFTTLRRGAFRGISATYLDLSYNDLKKIDHDAFKNIGFSLTVDLASTLLQNLDFVLDYNRTKFFIIFLNGTIINCNCNIIRVLDLVAPDTLLGSCWTDFGAEYRLPDNTTRERINTAYNCNGELYSVYMCVHMCVCVYVCIDV